MPRGIPSKSTVKPPTIRERALEPDAQINTQAEANEIASAILNPTSPLPKPLVTIRLRRVGPILTDTGHNVSIPSPAFVKEGDRVLVAIYQTEGDWLPIEPRMP